MVAAFGQGDGPALLGEDNGGGVRPLLVVHGHGGEHGHADARCFGGEDDVDVLVAHGAGQHRARVGAEGVIDAVVEQGVDVEDAVGHGFALFGDHGVDAFEKIHGR